MLSIVSMGGAVGPYRLTQELITALNPEAQFDLEQLAGVNSILSPEYLKATKNVDPAQGVTQPGGSPSILGAHAVQNALRSAGLRADQVGLLVGDSSTPFKTTPGTSQLVAEILQWKVDAFDLSGGGAAWIAQVDALRKWKPERTPEYVMLLSSNTPTQRASFEKGQECAQFGDVAVATIVSYAHKGKFTVSDSIVAGLPTFANKAVFPRFGSASVSADFGTVCAEEAAKLVSSHKARFGSSRYIVGLPTCKSEREFAQQLGCDRSAVQGSVSEYGYSVGAAVGAALANSTFSVGETFTAVAAGPGLSLGAVRLVCAR